MNILTAKGPLRSWLLRAGYKAITLPPLGVFVLEEAQGSSRLMRHHAAHWRQYTQMGLLKFYTAYLWWLWKVGYENHPMEIEARAAEEDLV